MVIWIVFTAVNFNVDVFTHFAPHHTTSIRTNSRGSFAGRGRAQLWLGWQLQRPPFCRSKKSWQIVST
jgi:hypothetical protein